MIRTTLRFLIPIISLIAVLFSVPVNAADKDVNVTNPVLNVQGNVTVDNTVPIQGSVAVTNLPTVGTRTPYQETITQAWPDAAVNIIFSDVPSGQRLVIEYISASLFMDPTQELGSFSVTLNAGGASASHTIAIPESGSEFTGSTTYSGGQALRLYTDQAPFVRLTKLPSTTSVVASSATVTISGYLIPLTSPSLAP